MTVMPDELNLLKITSSDLETWSKSLGARDQLPRLVRMLVLETCPDASRCYMPYGDDIGRPGCDGIVESIKGARNVPSGLSYWEMGTNEKPETKAGDDYNKRRDKVQTEQASGITFVFVTSRSWTKGESWAEEKRKVGFWKDVCVIDACTLSCWINEHPIIKLWLSRSLGKCVPGFRHLEWAWDEWRNACNPSLPSLLFESEVKRHKPAFHKWLNQQSETYIGINADSKEEALAFLYELLNLDEFEKFKNKVIIVDGLHEIDYLVQLVERGAIPVILDSQVGKRLCINAPGTHIIRICPQFSDLVVECSINLSSLSSYCIEKVVSMYKSDRVNQKNIIRDSCYSRTILRQLLSNNPDLKEPDWVNDERVDKDLIIPLLFGGYWQIVVSDTGMMHVNKEFIQALYKISEDELEDTYDRLIDLAQMPDSPIWYLCHGSSRYISFKYREESLKLLIKKNCIKRKHWERWQKATKVVFLSTEESPNSCHTLSPRFYILRICILIDAYKDALFAKTSYRPESIRNSICSTLFALSVKKFFSGNGRFLSLIAESWPDEYLSYLENIELFEEDNRDIIRQRSWEIAQSIACLAINSIYYERSICTFNRLYSLMDEEQIKDVIYNLFCWWHPQTNASTHVINAAARSLVKESSKLAWYVGARQFKRCRDCTHVNESAVLRGGDWQIPETYRENQDGLEILKNWADLLKKWEHSTLDTIVNHIDIIDAFSNTDRDDSWSVITQGIKGLPDNERGVCHMRIRATLRMLQKDAPDDFAGFAEFKRKGNLCIQETLPIDLYVRNSWPFLYDTQHVVACKELADSQKCVLRLARRTIRGLLMGGNIEFLKIIIPGKTNLWLLGESLACELTLEKICEFLTSCVSDTTVERCLKTGVVDAIIRNISATQYREVCDKLCAKLSPPKFLSLLLCMRWSPFLQSYIDKLPDEFRLIYWREVSTVYFDVYDETIDRAIAGLLSIERGDAALHAMSFKISRNDIVGKEEKLLVHIMEKLCRQQYMSMNCSYEIEQCLQFLEKRGVPLEVLAHLELHFFFHQRTTKINEDRCINHLGSWLWTNPSCFVRLFSRFMGMLSGDVHLTIRKQYDTERLSRCLVYSIPEGFCFEKWVRIVANLADRYNCNGDILHLCMYILGYVRRRYRDSWPTIDVCKAAQILFDKGKSDAFISGIITSNNGEWIPSDDYGIGAVCIPVLAKQATSIEEAYPEIAQLIRATVAFYQRGSDAEREEDEILKKLGGVYL